MCVCMCVGKKPGDGMKPPGDYTKGARARWGVPGVRVSTPRRADVASALCCLVRIGSVSVVDMHVKVEDVCT